MPKITKLSAEQVAAFKQRFVSPAKKQRMFYDAFVTGYGVGDTAQLELDEGDNSISVRRQVRAALRRQGLDMHYLPTRVNEPIHFEVVLWTPKEAEFTPPVDHPPAAAPSDVGQPPKRKRGRPAQRTVPAPIALAVEPAKPERAPQPWRAEVRSANGGAEPAVKPGRSPKKSERKTTAKGIPAKSA